MKISQLVKIDSTLFMKNFRPLFSLLLVSNVILISCSDDDGAKPASDQIAGNWELVSLNYSGSSSVSAAGTTLETDFVGTGKEIDYILELSENPNTISSSGSYTIELESTVSGQTVVTEQIFTEIVGAGTWEVVGNRLVVEAATTTGGVVTGGSSSFDILELTESSLRIAFDTTIVQSQAGAELSQSIDADYTLRRL